MAWTRLQLQKSFEYVYDFLLFTTEGEDDYPELMLPTLDFQTRVLGDGQIRYQYFSKKMENNRVLDIQTALSKNTIFSALRQNLVRRLLNTGMMVEQDIRMAIVERFIQLMRNSGHKFAFVRSVVQQALTKVSFMLERSKMDKKNPAFQPLYRPPNFRSAERIITKYVNRFIWFKKIELGDSFRQDWKRRIKRKKTRARGEPY